MTFKSTVATLALLMFGQCWLHAQPSAIQQLQNDQLIRQFQAPPPSLSPGTNAPPLYPGESYDVGPQHILRLKPRHDYFDVLLDSQAFFSDNASFAEKPQAISSWVFVNTLQAAFTPPVVALGSGKAMVALGLASQWYNYGDNRMEGFDFNAETLFASGKYSLGKWQLSAGLNLTRLVNQENYDETYRELMPNLGVQRVLPINNRLFFTLSEVVDYHVTEVPSVFGSRIDINNRLDDLASVTLTWQPTRHLLVQPFYRFQYSYYEYDTSGNYSRNDYVQSFGVAAAYYFNTRVSVRAFFNYNRKQSSDPLTSTYLEMNGGIGATLDIKF